MMTDTSGANIVTGEEAESCGCGEVHPHQGASKCTNCGPQCFRLLARNEFRAE